MSALHRIALLLFAASLCFLLDSCSSTSVRGVPRNLPTINLHGTPTTPPHSMDRKDYPFDENGQYVTAWAAMAGSPPGDSGFDSWRSHGGRVTGRSRASSGVKKYTASTKKSSPSSRNSSRTASNKSKGKSTGRSGSAVATKNKSSSGSNSGSTSKSKGGTYVVKSGDSLSSIARRNGTTVAKLKAANGLKSDMIRDGRALKIPK